MKKSETPSPFKVRQHKASALPTNPNSLIETEIREHLMDTDALITETVSGRETQKQRPPAPAVYRRPQLQFTTDPKPNPFLQASVPLIFSNKKKTYGTKKPSNGWTGPPIPLLSSADNDDIDSPTPPTPMPKPQPKSKGNETIDLTESQQSMEKSLEDLTPTKKAKVIQKSKNTRGLLEREIPVCNSKTSVFSFLFFSFVFFLFFLSLHFYFYFYFFLP